MNQPLNGRDSPWTGFFVRKFVLEQVPMFRLVNSIVGIALITWAMFRRKLIVAENRRWTMIQYLQ